MILDLLTFSTTLNDALDLVVYCIDSGTFSITILVYLLISFLIVFFAWRSTDIPQSVPPPPTSAFYITINSASNTLGRRQTLTDLRIVTPEPHTDFAHSFGRRITRGGNNALRIRPFAERSTSSQVGEGNSTSGREQQQQQPNRRSVFFGFLRHPLSVQRGWIPLQHRFSIVPRGIYVFGRHFHQQRPRNLPQEQIPQPNERTELRSTQTSLNDSPSAYNLSNEQENSTSRQDVPQNSELGNSEINGQSPAENHSNTESNSAIENNITTETLELENSQTSSPDLSETNPCDITTATSRDENTSLQTETSEATSSQTSTMSSNSVPDVKFTLKFLNDTQMEVTTQLGEKIIDFKRRHFAQELAENKIVRLIFNGRVLDQDNRTLQDSGIFDHCVVHCLIVTPQQSSQQSRQGSSYARGSSRSPRGPEPGMFFVSLVGILLVFLWFVCINFGSHLFTQSAIVSLSVLTGIFVIGVIAFYMPVQTNNIN